VTKSISRIVQVAAVDCITTVPFAKEILGRRALTGRLITNLHLTEGNIIKLFCTPPSPLLPFTCRTGKL
jgi:hypothetical protein